MLLQKVINRLLDCTVRESKYHSMLYFVDCTECVGTVSVEDVVPDWLRNSELRKETVNLLLLFVHFALWNHAFHCCFTGVAFCGFLQCRILYPLFSTRRNITISVVCL